MDIVKKITAFDEVNPNNPIPPLDKGTKFTNHNAQWQFPDTG